MAVSDPSPETHDVRGRLLRIFGLGFGLAVVLGGVIGSGILRNPSVVAAGFLNPTWIILAWLAGGLFVAVDAMPTVELGAAIPQSGGPYPLAVRAIGPFAGFFVGWADWLQLIFSTGFIAVAFGEQVQRLGSAAGPDDGRDRGAAGSGLRHAQLHRRQGGRHVPEYRQRAEGAGPGGDRGGSVSGARQTPAVAAPPPPPVFSWVAAAVAIRAIYGAYGGWEAAVYFSEELHEPERNVARATFGGIALVTAIYVLINAAVLHVLPMGVLTHSNLAVSDAMAAVLGPGSGVVVTLVAMWCVATIANLQVMEHVRNTYAMAREGRLPAALATVSKSGTPRAALLVVVVATSLVILGADHIKGGLYEVLLNLYAPNIMIIFLMLSYGSIRLRQREPNLPRPYKMPFYPWPAIITIAANALLVVMFVISDWRTGLYSLLSLSLAFPLYALGRTRKRA